MTKLLWDQLGERRYETGVDHGVFYPRQSTGIYSPGVAWNGLTAVTESPSGAESNKVYADNIVYLNLISAEEYGATIECLYYPNEFGAALGEASPHPGVSVGQQSRTTFGFSYRTLVGNDIVGQDYGYKLHFVWGASAAPSERAHNTVNDSPEATPFSFELSTVPEAAGGNLKPTASISIDSTRVPSSNLAALETVIYGSSGVDPLLPTPEALIGYFAGSTTVASLPDSGPAYTAGTKTITIPSTTGVNYTIDGVVQTAGPVVITKDTVVVAYPKSGYVFPEVSVNAWFYKF